MQPKFTFKKTYFFCWGLVLVLAVSLMLPQNVVAQEKSNAATLSRNLGKVGGRANANFQNPKALLFKNFQTKQMGGLSVLPNSVLKQNANRLPNGDVPVVMTAGAYCTPTATTTDNTGITNVTFGGINNSTTGSTTSAGAYHDYTAIGTTLLTPGNSYNLGVRVNTDGNFTVKVFAWIDWNKDNTFDNSVGSTELYTLGQVTNVADGAPSLSPLSITVPVGSSGVYTMRVRAVFGAASVSNPCGNQNWSEAEDYTINTPQPPCTGTPAPGAITGPATACSGVGFTLGLTNPTTGGSVSYLWEYSTVGATGPWTSGGSSSTYSTSLTAATWYRATVTCGGSGASTTTAVKAIALNPFTQCYCTPPVESCAFSDYITNVTIGTLNNSSACSANGFGDYKALPAGTVYSGTLNPITVVGVPYDALDDNADGYAVWIDLNRNGVYETSEALQLGDNLAQADATFHNFINIPANVAPGLTGLRVRVAYGDYPDGYSPCDLIAGFGETEEYLVNIQPCVPTTITSHPSNASVVCGNNTTFTAAATGTYPTYSWQYLAPTTGAVWQTVSNGGIYSGATTNTLTLTAVDATYTGYQYRLLVTGGCSAPNPTNAATLTVTQIVPVVSPASASICSGTVQPLTLTNTLSDATIWTENFDTFLPTGWVSQNNSQPVGPTPWIQGNPANFTAFNGAPESYASALWSSTTTTGVGDISNWLLTPVTTFKNGDKFKFYSRIPTGTEYPDRIEVRISTNGASTNVGSTSTSVGDFSTVILTINPTLVAGVYPKVWTEFTATVSGVTGTVSGRAAFRYFVTNGGGAGDNSNCVGIDNVRFIQSGSAAQGIWTGPAGTIFTNAGGTTPYVTGTPATTVYVSPTTQGVNNYQVSFTTPTPCTSTTITIPVTVSKPVTGVVNPTNKSACIGQTATFTVSGAGGPITYQWQQSADGGLTWPAISGATSASYTTGAVTQLMNNYQYRAVLTGGPCGAVTSGAATLTVNALPIVAISAPDLALVPGAETTITATSTPAATTYVWTRNGVNIGGSNTNTRLARIDSIGTYQVTVTDGNGCVNTSNTLVIGSEATDRLWIYPNPSNGQFQVRLYWAEATSEYRTISIFDSKGQFIASKQLTLANNSAPYTATTFDLTKYPAGVYVVKVAHKYSGKIVSGLVIKQTN